MLRDVDATFRTIPSTQRVPVDILVLSPHIDDAAFSLGAAITEGRFRKVTVLNVFSRSRCTADDRDMDEDEVTLLRKAEDDAFYEELEPGVSRLHLDWLDAPLRLRIPDTRVCCQPPPSDDSIEVIQLSRIASGHMGPHTILLAPLGLGNHVDHLAVRMAARNALHAGFAVGFYEELPYAARMSPGEIESVVGSCSHEWGTLLSAFVCVSGRGSMEKVNSVNAYRSQTDQMTLHSIEFHGARLIDGRFAERLWCNPLAASVFSASLHVAGVPT